MATRAGFQVLICSLMAITGLLSGCAIPAPDPAITPATEATEAPTPSKLLTNALPEAGAVAGWTPTEAAQTYDSETIFALVNGQADAFFAYGFEQVAAQRYQNAEGAIADVHIWQLTDAENAYGLFTTHITGQPVDVGNGGDADPGRRLVFWQNRYTVHIFARQEIPNGELRAFGDVVSAALPAGGERPRLVDRLPAQGLVERSVIFFHQEISIQNTLWLGGENVLGLGPETDGVIAQYTVDDAPVHLLLIEYADQQAASSGVQALKCGQFENLAAAEARGNLLGAIFGQVSDSASGDMLEKALQR